MRYFLKESNWHLLDRSRKRKFSNWNKPEPGQSMIEFAVVMVVLIIILSGAVDLGRAFFTHLALRDAAQEGVIFGSLVPTNCTAIEQRVRDTSNLPIDLNDFDDVQVNITTGGADCAVATASQACVGNEIRVRVTANNFQISMPFMGAIFGTQTIAISSEAAGAILQIPCP